MDATLIPKGQHYQLALERRLPHSPEKVWRVLTERKLLQQWFPCDVEGRWEVGARLRFEFLRGEGDGLPEEEMRGEVLAADPHRLLEFRWGKSVIRAQLLPDGDGTRLLFSETLDDRSWGARNAAGWEMCLDSLELVLKGGALAKFAWEVWKPKFEHYRKKFEPAHGPQDDPSPEQPTESQS